MKIITFEKIVQNALESIISMVSDISPYKKASIMRSLTRITDAINETLDQEKKPFNSTYDSALKKATDMLILYGYSDGSFMYYKEDFLEWFMKNGIKSPLYKAEKITKEIIDTMMMDYFLFKVDNDREPNDYNEFRTYMLRDDKN